MPAATPTIDLRDHRGSRHELLQQVRRGSSIRPDRATQVLPVLPALATLLPDGGLRRGSTVVVDQSPGLALALLAGPSAQQTWCAVVGVPTFGVAAAAEAGIALERLALIPNPGQRWSETVAALVDGMDLVVVAPPARLAPRETRRLTARARDRGTVLVALDRWDGADLRLTATDNEWEGVTEGVGRLRARRLTVAVQGRGAAARPRSEQLWLPGPHGTYGSASAPHGTYGSASAPHDTHGSASAPHGQPTTAESPVVPTESIEAVAG